MKKTQLRNIIRESIGELINEQSPWNDGEMCNTGKCYDINWSPCWYHGQPNHHLGPPNTNPYWETERIYDQQNNLVIPYVGMWIQSGPDPQISGWPGNWAMGRINEVHKHIHHQKSKEVDTPIPVGAHGHPHIGWTNPNYQPGMSNMASIPPTSNNHGYSIIRTAVKQACGPKTSPSPTTHAKIIKPGDPEIDRMQKIANIKK